MQNLLIYWQLGCGPETGGVRGCKIPLGVRGRLAVRGDRAREGYRGCRWSVNSRDTSSSTSG